MIKSITKADQILNEIQSFYIESICSHPLPEGLFPHLAFFEDVDMYDKPAYYRVYVLSVNQETKDCWIKYENGSKDTIFLSALNIDWLKTIAERQMEMISTERDRKETELKNLLLLSADFIPPTHTYKWLLAFFVEFFECPEARAREIVGNMTGEQIIKMINLLNEISLEEIHFITWENKEYKALCYTLKGVKYSVSEIGLQDKLIDRESGDYQSIECCHLDEEIQYYVSDDFWNKSDFEKKVTLIQEVWQD